MKIRIMSTKDIAACPKQSLLPDHYNDDNTCKCPPERRLTVVYQPYDESDMGKLTLSRVLTMARDLNTPGEPNQEYIRGQASLICDMFGLIGHDDFHEVVTEGITHRISVESALSELSAIAGVSFT